MEELDKLILLEKTLQPLNFDLIQENGKHYTCNLEGKKFGQHSIDFTQPMHTIMWKVIENIQLQTRRDHNFHMKHKFHELVNEAFQS